MHCKVRISYYTKGNTSLQHRTCFVTSLLFVDIVCNFMLCCRCVLHTQQRVLEAAAPANTAAAEQPVSTVEPSSLVQANESAILAAAAPAADAGKSSSSFSLTSNSSKLVVFATVGGVVAALALLAVCSQVAVRAKRRSNNAPATKFPDEEQEAQSGHAQRSS
jgi:hypothetical protein